MVRLLAAALLAATVALPAHADGIVEKVNGITLDEAGKVVRFDAIQIDRDGKVVKLLSRKDRRPKQLDYLLDGKGATLLPGMIDAHGHVMGLGLSMLTLDLTAARSLEEALAMVRAYAAANPERRWIIGRGWNQEAWGLARFPTAAELDGAVADRPVWLERIDGHAGWANSKAMELAGVTAATRAPAGGKIENGIFVDAAQELVAAKIAAPKPAEWDLALVRAQEALLKEGVTAIADMGTDMAGWQAMRRAGDEGRLRIRIMAYAAGTDAMVAIAGPRPTPWLYGDRLRLGGVKLYLDGALGSRGAWLKAPYADAPGERGLQLMGSAELRNRMSRAAMDGFQVAVHAIGDAADDEILSAIEELALTYKGDRRWRIEHAQVVDPADLPRFGKHGIVASMQPIHMVSDRTMAEARLGPARLGGAYAWASMLASGARLAFGSDVPVERPQPFKGIAAAITRADAAGQPFGGWQPQERISREAALAAYTSGAAHAGFAEAKFGRLAPGTAADFVLVDTDPLLATPAEVAATKVRETWIAGQRVWTAGAVAASPEVAPAR